MNTTGTLNLINAMEAAGSVRRTIFISSMLVCQNGYSPFDDLNYCPDTTYGKSKVEMERIISERMGLQVQSLSLKDHFGVGAWSSGPDLQFFLIIRRGLYVHPGHIQVREQLPTLVMLLASFFSCLLQIRDDCVGSVFYVGDYSEYIVREWANLVQSGLGASRIRTVPLFVLKVIAELGDRLKLRRVASSSTNQLSSY